MHSGLVNRPLEKGETDSSLRKEQPFSGQTRQRISVQSTMARQKPRDVCRHTPQEERSLPMERPPVSEPSLELMTVQKSAVRLSRRLWPAGGKGKKVPLTCCSESGTSGDGRDASPPPTGLLADVTGKGRRKEVAGGGSGELSTAVSKCLPGSASAC